MARPVRFPQLALPFSIAGAAGGWLSGGLVVNPLWQHVQRDPRPASAVVAAGMAAGAGALITRWCRAEGIEYDLSVKPPEDGPRGWWLRPSAAVLCAGALTGWLIAALLGGFNGPWIGALGGLACAAVFVPVCLAVVAAGRRSVRARMGSLVAASDHRAVWGILAITLGVTTLEALPEWPAAAARQAPWPWAVAGMLLAAFGVTGAALLFDLGALRRAKGALGPGLVEKDPSEMASAHESAPRLDLGLGEEVAAVVARSAAAYRGRDRTLALVKGNPREALSALRRAIVRGAVGVAVFTGVALAHLAANSHLARIVFDEKRCGDFDYESCESVADHLRTLHPARALDLYVKACGVTSPRSCLAAAEMFEAQRDMAARSWERSNDPSIAEEVEHHRENARTHLARACKYGMRSACHKEYVKTTIAAPRRTSDSTGGR